MTWHQTPSCSIEVTRLLGQQVDIGLSVPLTFLLKKGLMSSLILYLLTKTPTTRTPFLILDLQLQQKHLQHLRQQHQALQLQRCLPLPHHFVGSSPLILQTVFRQDPIMWRN